MERRVLQAHEGGDRLKNPPTVWILADDKPGHSTQSVGLAQALEWSYEVKELHFTALNRLGNRLLGASLISLNKSRSASLTPPWPDLVIATGRRAAPIARWIQKQSQDQTRLAHLGRKGGEIAELFDLVVTCMHFRLPPHPRRIETIAPLNSVSLERLVQAAERWHGVFENAPHPHIALLVGGSSATHRLDADTAHRIGEEVRAFADTAGGMVFATTSPRTGRQATHALSIGLGKSHYLHTWQPGQQDNPYLAYLALADVLVVTGESESMLAETAATDKPVYIYPLPERSRGVRARVKDWIATRAQTAHGHTRGTVRPQWGLAHVCTRLIERGIVQPPRDLNILHQTLVLRGAARFFGEPLETGQRSPLREMDEVVQRVQMLLGVNQGDDQESPLGQVN